MCYSAIVVARNAHAFEESYRRRIRELEEANRPRVGRSAVRLNDGPFRSEPMIAGVDFAA